MDECIEWTGARIKDGYGHVRRNGKAILAHRAAWTDEHGEIPEGMYVCHTCDNPPCVNVEHLFLGTQSDNMRDMTAKGRHPRCSGEQHGRHKLTIEQVAAIRASTDTQRVLAARYDVARSTIHDIKKEVTWRPKP